MPGRNRKVYKAPRLWCSECRRGFHTQGGLTQHRSGHLLPLGNSQGQPAVANFPNDNSTDLSYAEGHNEHHGDADNGYHGPSVKYHPIIDGKSTFLVALGSLTLYRLMIRYNL